MDRYQVVDSDVAVQLERNRRWHESSGKEGSAAYFAFERHPSLDLRNAILVDAALQEADFQGSRLEGASLVRVLAGGLSLQRSLLDGADFTKAELVESDFSQVQGRSTSFKKANLSRARFEKADLRSSDFSYCTALCANFQAADLRDTNFSGAVISGANFSSTSLSGANFSGAVLDAHSRFSGSIGIDQIIATHVIFGEQSIATEAVLPLLRSLS